MRCKICGCENIEVTYKGKIRNGKVGVSTLKDVEMYKCKNCLTIWHDLSLDLNKFYESEDYRISLEGTSDIDTFYELHDYESMNKFECTGTEIFRNRTVADIGCGGGAFLDFISGLAKETIAIEPSNTYRKILREKGYKVFSYMSEALQTEKGKIDTIVSFDVIEHVEDSVAFVKEAYELLAYGGRCIIGTPTDAPVMRELLGETYESFLFSTQHPWVLSGNSFKEIAKKVGILQYDIQYYQRYGLGNLFYWLNYKKPGKQMKYDFISQAADKCWKSSLELEGKADYILFEFTK